MGSAADIREPKQAIGLAAVVEAAGCELRPAGPGRLRGCCPLHSEKTPSFFVFIARQRWRCFGCGEGGDLIDFIRRARGCSFGEALSILGVDDPKRTAAELSRIRIERKRREAERWRERETAWTLARAIRTCHSMLARITPETLDQYDLIIYQLPILEHQHDILIHGDPEDRTALVRELAGLRLLPRRLMFRRDFDFSAWVRQISDRGAEYESSRRHRGTQSDPGGRLRTSAKTATM